MMESSAFHPFYIYTFFLVSNALYLPVAIHIFNFEGVIHQFLLA
jgi:hypothetical protein